MSDTEAKYRIVEKHITGLEVSKFTIETLDGSKKTTITYEELAKLANSGKVSNITSTIDIINQRYIIDFNNKLDDIPIHKSTELLLQCRILDSNKKCIGYKAVDDKGKIYKISINKTWELASNNCIKGVKAKIICNKRAIISDNDFNIKELPVIIT